ncbi:MAG: hypothetical protein HN981_02620 [Candidatus Pacebacteria bacterium]|jgi:RNase P protein component|nr:hypothetical protein [Candidatus Paceibacterota bacterium]MBT6756442.1 hypothetical protein [Candidatus Paceibacterota bacterium]MBT6921264.1 hypothetical protein [Candidatus Paceibacterota bacterium]
MLSKSKKLNLRDLETKKIFSEFYFKTSNFTVNFDFNSKADENQFAVIVPKKKVVLAVDRNAYKRFFFNHIPKYLINLETKKLRAIFRVTSKGKITEEKKQIIKKDLIEIEKFILDSFKKINKTSK